MGSLLWWTGTRHNQIVDHEETWSFIDLDDFQKSTKMEAFWYFYLWVEMVTSVSVYAVDTVTAINLLVFDKFTSIKPAISLEVSRFIIGSCIIASLINVAFEQWRVYRIIKRDSVAESFLDILSFRVQSVRMGKKGKGRSRFLVFSELARTKKGAETVALFTFYTFQTWIRVVVVSGARQVVNAITLFSVYRAKFDHTQVGFGQTIVVFFQGVKALFASNYQQAFILGGMLFTLLIWAFAALSLLTAALCYILFLWHYIPNDAGGLLGYCRSRTNKKLRLIIEQRRRSIVVDASRKRLKAARKALKEQKFRQDRDFIHITRKPSMASDVSTVFGIDVEIARPMLSRTSTTSSMNSVSYDESKQSKPYGYI